MSITKKLISGAIHFLAPKPPCLYVFKVTLVNTFPRIWREIVVPSWFTLYELHTVLQVAMGWDDEHLHVFSVKDELFGTPDNTGLEDTTTKSDTLRKLEHFKLKLGESFRYLYNFDSNWKHDLVLVDIKSVASYTNVPVCLDGQGACPPEFTKGAVDYMELLDILSNTSHENYKEKRELVGGDFRPELFLKDEVNVVLQQTLKTVPIEQSFGDVFNTCLKVEQRVSPYTHLNPAKVNKSQIEQSVNQVENKPGKHLPSNYINLKRRHK